MELRRGALPPGPPLQQPSSGPWGPSWPSPPPPPRRLRRWLHMCDRVLRRRVRPPGYHTGFVDQPLGPAGGAPRSSAKARLGFPPAAAGTGRRAPRSPGPAGTHTPSLSPPARLTRPPRGPSPPPTPSSREPRTTEVLVRFKPPQVGGIREFVKASGLRWMGWGRTPAAGASPSSSGKRLPSPYSVSPLASSETRPRDVLRTGRPLPAPSARPPPPCAPSGRRRPRWLRDPVSPTELSGRKRRHVFGRTPGKYASGGRGEPKPPEGPGSPGLRHQDLKKPRGSTDGSGGSRFCRGGPCLPRATVTGKTRMRDSVGPSRAAPEGLLSVTGSPCPVPA
ncbi:proline-rich protein HaeIII subfamily 1-like [Vulpes lagopus]|uniref:proline-rich protein HaeIII subfamily 1-like n=1 Tax=Vulpes lagopus TaxID=494514 RepID=UPI001BC9F1DD|nr:proline-rich protein HaeIII subfamily 1-like [Vulpes lagopus]